MADFNVKLCKEHGFAPSFRKCSLYETNDNGWWKRDYALARRMAVTSTLLQHTSINLQTWTSPDGISANQTDHVMTDSHQIMHRNRL
jgi:hypothetical protein